MKTDEQSLAECAAYRRRTSDLHARKREAQNALEAAEAEVIKPERDVAIIAAREQAVWAARRRLTVTETELAEHMARDGEIAAIEEKIYARRVKTDAEDAERNHHKLRAALVQAALTLEEANMALTVSHTTTSDALTRAGRRVTVNSFPFCGVVNCGVGDNLYAALLTIATHYPDLLPSTHPAAQRAQALREVAERTEENSRRLVAQRVM